VDTQERKAGGIEPPGKFVDRGSAGPNSAFRADHPIGDAIDASSSMLLIIASNPTADWAVSSDHLI
jgi:hypothetical protein